MIALCYGKYLLISRPLNLPQSAGWHLWLWRGAKAFKPAAPLHIVLSAAQQNRGLGCKIKPRAAASCRRTGQVRRLLVYKSFSHANICFPLIGLHSSVVNYLSKNDQQGRGRPIRSYEDSCSRGGSVYVKTLLLFLLCWAFYHIVHIVIR